MSCNCTYCRALGLNRETDSELSKSPKPLDVLEQESRPDTHSPQSLVTDKEKQSTSSVRDREIKASSSQGGSTPSADDMLARIEEYARTDMGLVLHKDTKFLIKKGMREMLAHIREYFNFLENESHKGYLDKWILLENKLDALGDALG